MSHHSCLNISLFTCRARRAKLSKPAVIWTHDCDVRGMGLFSILSHKLLCNAKFLRKQECKAVCDIKSRIDPSLSPGMETKLGVAQAFLDP